MIQMCPQIFKIHASKVIRIVEIFFLTFGEHFYTLFFQGKVAKTN